MITSDDLAADRPDFDPDTFGSDSGALAVTALEHDFDGDGVLDTQVFELDDALVVATDSDGDGDADHLTIVAVEGGYSAWEFHRDADGAERWERTDSGDLRAGHDTGPR